jgi:hypothetical protein
VHGPGSGRRDRGAIDRWSLPVASVGATLFAFWTLVAAGIGIDEAWNLHVVERLVQGDALYRQVRYFPTPLALYIGVAGVAGPGVEVLVSKALLALTFGVTFATALVILRALGVGRAGRAVAGLALLGVGVPYASSAYNSMAVAFLLVTALFVVRANAGMGHPPPDGRDGTDAASIGAGLAAGACFLTKWNVGGATLVAVLLAFALPWLHGRVDVRTSARAARLAVAAFVATTVVGLAPVLLQGAGHAFVDQLRDAPGQLAAPTSFTAGLEAFGRALAAGDVDAALASAPFAVVLAAGVTAAAALVRALRRGGAPTAAATDDRDGPAVAALFFAASAVLLLPRNDHVAYISAPAVVVLVASGVPVWRRLVRRGRVAAVLATTLVLSAPSVAAAVVVGHDWDASRDLAVVRTPHFRGALTDRRTWDEIVADTARLHAIAGPRGDVFIISQKAGLYYLVGDLRNPTPYDYPDKTEFGRHGLHQVERDLASGVIRYTCIDHAYAPGLAPTAVIAAVQAHSHLVASMAICDLWATGPAPP